MNTPKEDQQLAILPTLTPSNIFCSPDADLILLSSDNVEFRVFGRILAEASMVFQDMMQLGESSSPGALNSVRVSENAETLDMVLRFIYPIPDPKIFSFDTLKLLMDTADKYFLKGMMHSLKNTLIQPAFTEPQPLRAYALACIHGLQDEAKIISRYCLKTDILQQGDIYDELAIITGRDLLRLIKLHQTRATQIISILNNNGPSPCSGTGATLGTPSWWIEFRARAKEEVRSRPLGDTIFHPKFLAACVHAVSAGGSSGCPQCPANYLSNGSQARLEQLRGMIEALPDTV